MTAPYLKAQAAVVRRPRGAFELETVQIRRPRGDEVLVRVVATGLCHADVLARDQHLPVPLPAVLGHEGAGIVEEVGSLVKTLKRGDHVVMSYGFCNDCAYCAHGRQAYCREFFHQNFECRTVGDSAIRDEAGREIHAGFFSQSSFATHALSFERNTIKVPADAPLELLGPLGCGIQTGAGAVFNTLQVRPGSSMIVIGAGAVGQSAVMAAKIAGCLIIVAADLVPSRLDLARSLGATHTINVSAGNFVAASLEVLPSGADYVIEATGRPTSISQGLDVLGKLGTIGVIGGPPVGTRGDFDVNDLLLGGKTIRGIIQGDGVPQTFIPKMVSLYLSEVFPFDRMISLYDFADINQAVDDSLSGKTVKSVIRMHP